MRRLILPERFHSRLPPRSRRRPWEWGAPGNAGSGNTFLEDWDVSEVFNLGGELTGAHAGLTVSSAGTPVTVAGHVGNASRLVFAEGDEFTVADHAAISFGSTDSMWIGYWVNIHSLSAQCFIRKLGADWANSGEYRCCYNADATNSLEFHIQRADNGSTRIQPDAFVNAHGAIQADRPYLVLQGFDYGPFAPNHGRISIKIGDASTGNVSPSWDFAAHEVTSGGIRDGTNSLKFTGVNSDLGPVFMGRNPTGGWEGARDSIWDTLWNDSEGRTYVEIS